MISHFKVAKQVYACFEQLMYNLVIKNATTYIQLNVFKYKS